MWNSCKQSRKGDVRSRGGGEEGLSSPWSEETVILSHVPNPSGEQRKQTCAMPGEHAQNQRNGYRERVWVYRVNKKDRQHSACRCGRDGKVLTLLFARSMERALGFTQVWSWGFGLRSRRAQCIWRSRVLISLGLCMYTHVGGCAHVHICLRSTSCVVP